LLSSYSGHPIAKNLNAVLSIFPNSIDTVEAEGIRKTILLHSSRNARTISTPALISGRENVNAPEDEKFKKPFIPAAVLLEGKFSSLFTNRLTQTIQDSLAAYQVRFKPVCDEDNQIIVVGDGDMVLNAVSRGDQPIAMGMNPFTFGTQREFPFANRDFLLNCLEYLVNEQNLMEAKSKDYVARLLDTKKVNAEKQTWTILNLAVPVLLVVLFGLIFQWLRKRRYAQKMKQQ
ncbi:MAG TPA: gliding motility-associated ABC transporter substrate-binding protein GldG, partial [Chitinophagaceae bacterium]|nr:gliding motility-associated ABC transporter substrate-binding protein GldG [Chitinophagaceae bacterium]